MRLSRPAPGLPKCHPWVTLWGATGSNTRVTLCDRILDSGGLRSIEPSGLLKRDIARRHSGGYQGSHPAKTAIENPATALPARLRAGALAVLSLDQMPDHTTPRLTHTAQTPCVRVSTGVRRQAARSRQRRLGDRLDLLNLHHFPRQRHSINLV